MIDSGSSLIYMYHAKNLPVVDAIPIVNPRKRQAIVTDFFAKTEELPLKQQKLAKEYLHELFNQFDRDFYNQKVEFTTMANELKEKFEEVQTTAHICMEVETQLKEQNKQLKEENTVLHTTIKDTPQPQCSICMEGVNSLIIDGTQMLSCESNHIFCQDCLVSKIEGSIITAPADGMVRCGHNHCKHNLKDHTHFEKIVPERTRRDFANACMETRVRKEMDESNTATNISPDAFVCKRPCCGKAMPLNFDGCMSFDCPDCNACFCGLCMKVFTPKGNNLAENNALFRCHEHVSTCKHNIQTKNADGVASYYINEEAQVAVTKHLWMKYFLTQRMLKDNSPANVRKLIGTRPSVPKMTAFCASLGLATGPYGFIGVVGADNRPIVDNEVIILD